MDFLYVFENIVGHKAEILATLGGLGGVYMFLPQRGCSEASFAAIVPPIKWVLLFLEQLALDFIKPAYNFLKIAGTSLGAVRAPFSSEHRAKISAANSRRTGYNNPMYGLVAANAIGVSVFTVDLVLVQSFASRDAAAAWLGVSDITVLRYIRSGKVFR
ncbi:hypothetical protein BC938DRAFT_471477, partial [Jimgerdemannia flammicorona]